MDQFYLKFNLETLDQSYKEFKFRYTCDEYDVIFIVKIRNLHVYGDKMISSIAAENSKKAL